MTHTSTEQPWWREHTDEIEHKVASGEMNAATCFTKMLWLVSEASQAQRVPMSEHEQALEFLTGLHPSITIDGPPMAIAELIFDAVQADQRALKDDIAKKERNLDWMRKELAKRAPKAKDCQRPENMARGCFGYCMKGITQEKQG